ncbi:MAG: hypothetical protein ABIH22_04620 [Candidatus Margulisiibacteriota bacterium]
MKKNTKHYFCLKGKQAEDIVHELAEKTFLTDWCYPNPKWPDGKELCDLLVIFGDIAIIFQIKNLACDSSGQFNQSEIEKNLNQLIGAKRHLFELEKDIQLSNPRRGNESFNSKGIKEIYLLSIIFGENKSFCFGGQPYKGHYIHVFDEQFTEIALNELDTIADFIDYLRKKEDLLTKGSSKIIVNGGEEELLAYYLLNNRNFDELKKDTVNFIGEDIWKHLKDKDEYKRKKEADKISYGWDGIINRAHEGKHKYESVARELARPNRLLRRALSKAFIEAHMKAHRGNKDGIYRSMISIDGVTYCFLFQNDYDEPRVKRQSMLSLMCMIARIKIKENRKVIGIATETKLKPVSYYDFLLLDMPELTQEFIDKVQQAQKETGIFVNPITHTGREDEYPSVEDN